MSYEQLMTAALLLYADLVELRKLVHRISDKQDEEKFRRAWAAVDRKMAALRGEKD